MATAQQLIAKLPHCEWWGDFARLHTRLFARRVSVRRTADVGTFGLYCAARIHGQTTAACGSRILRLAPQPRFPRHD